MEIEPLAIPDVKLVRPRVFDDARGFFLERYKRSSYRRAGLPDFVQDNHSRSHRHTLRGLHFQLPPAAQGKLVSVVRGEILDVAVDVRPASPHFGRWVSARLSEDDHHQLWVPPGFAHGFLVRSEVADVLYKVTHEYAPEHERGLRWDDPDLGIHWGVDRGGREPLLSPRDAQLPRLMELRAELAAWDAPPAPEALP